jgi:hypothetical protein
MRERKRHRELLDRELAKPDRRIGNEEIETAFVKFEVPREGERSGESRRKALFDKTKAT